jgi:hypothetical protein
LALMLGLSGPALAANPQASCAGLVSSSVAGDAGARAEIQFGAFAEAEELGITVGALQAEFARFHDRSAEVCLG